MYIILPCKNKIYHWSGWIIQFCKKKILKLEIFSHKTQPPSCIIKAITREDSSSLLSEGLDWIEGSLCGRWTVSRLYYWCNYSQLRPFNPSTGTELVAWKRKSLFGFDIQSQSWENTQPHRHPQITYDHNSPAPWFTICCLKYTCNSDIPCVLSFYQKQRLGQPQSWQQ